MPMVKSPLLEGKVAIITGASSGIGKGVASCLIKEGAKVVIADTDDEKGNKTAANLDDNCWYLNTDVTIEFKL